MTNMAPPTLQDLENDGRLADANSNPGMNLLLSLTLKLVPNAKNGEMGNTFDFAHAPPMLPNGPGPGEANATLSQNAPPPPPVSAVPDMRPTASAAPMAPPLGTGKAPPVLDGMPNVPPLQEPLLPPFPAPGVSGNGPFPVPFGPFDPTTQLDSIASAASETAANEFGEGMYSKPPADPAVQLPTIPPPFFPSQSPASYLSMMRQASLGAQSFGGPRLDATAGSTPESVARTPSPSNVQNAMLYGPNTPRSIATPMPISRDASFESQNSLLHLSTSEPELPRPNLVKLERDLSAPDSLRHIPRADDEEAQRKAIEEAVRNLSAHHQMASTAALQHHQRKMGMPLKPGDEPLPSHAAAKHALEPLNGPAKRARSDTPQAPEFKPQLLSKSGGTTPVLARAEELQRSASTSDLASQKRFQCPKCSRAFARAYNLNTHLSTHDPDPSRAKPFPCPYKSCKSEGGRSFSRKHDLQRHVASVHEWEPEPGVSESTGEVVSGGDTGGLASLGLGAPGKKFRCDKCMRAFVRRDALRRHHCERMAEHTDDARDSQPDSPASPYAVRNVSGDVVHQVALQLMAEAEAKGETPSAGDRHSPVDASRSSSAISVAR